MDVGAENLTDGCMNTFANAVALRVASRDGDGANACVGEKKLKIVTDEFGTVVMKTSKWPGIATKPTEFEGAFH